MSTKKRKKRSHKKGPSKVLFVLISAVILLIPIVSYLGIQAWNQSNQKQPIAGKIKTDEDVVEKMKQILNKDKHITSILSKDEEQKTKEKPQPSVAKKQIKTDKNESDSQYYLSEIKDYATSLAQIEYEQKDKPKKDKPKNLKDKPSLMIIIDDVSFGFQVKKLKQTDLKLNLSYLPPTKRHPNSADIAKSDKNALLHLPLEAMRHNSPETKTLKTTDDMTAIEDTISKLRKLYPNVRYTNNHTGSKFTADLEAMKRLLTILKKYDFVFIDSKTTRNSKAKEASIGIQEDMLQRDIFLDNKPDVEYIQNQLKKAVDIAKKTGFAIAIGHPHKATIKALKNSKNILEGIYLVNIDEL